MAEDTSEFTVVDVELDGGFPKVTLRAPTREPFDRLNGKVALEYARTQASKRGHACDAIRNQSGSYPVDAEGRTPDGLFSGAVAVAAFQAEYTFGGRL